MEFMYILKEEEKISKSKAILSFGFVSIMLLLGKFDLYVVETVKLVKNDLFEN